MLRDLGKIVLLLRYTKLTRPRFQPDRLLFPPCTKERVFLSSYLQSRLETSLILLWVSFSGTLFPMNGHDRGYKISQCSERNSDAKKSPGKVFYFQAFGGLGLRRDVRSFTEFLGAFTVAVLACLDDNPIECLL